MSAATPQPPSSRPGDGPSSRPRRLQLNPEALKIVPASQRRFWEQMADEVELDIAQKFRKRWTSAETARVILADPGESYDDVAKELGRSPGAVRYRRMAMVHLLREEHGAPERVAAYIEDPKANHKHHDYFQVHETLRGLGYYSLPVSEQFRHAQPLRQPSVSWRGDGTAASLQGGGQINALRQEVQRLLREARETAEQAESA